MADISVAAPQVSSGKFALASNEVSTVVFDGEVDPVQIITDGTAEVWYSFDGVTPTVGGKQCFCIPQGAVVMDSRDPHTTDSVVIKLISTGTPAIVIQHGN